jgi:hypothetical protein
MAAIGLGVNLPGAFLGIDFPRKHQQGPSTGLKRIQVNNWKLEKGANGVRTIHHNSPCKSGPVFR